MLAPCSLLLLLLVAFEPLLLLLAYELDHACHQSFMALII
jgi:hypothetical protein